jgi:hypothetical protein
MRLIDQEWRLAVERRQNSGSSLIRSVHFPASSRHSRLSPLLSRYTARAPTVTCHMSLFINCCSSASAESIILCPCPFTPLCPSDTTADPFLLGIRSSTKGGRGQTEPFLNALPVCSTIRVESMLCATVCNLRKWRHPALHSLKGFAPELTVYMRPAIADPSKRHPSMKFVLMIGQHTETFSANPTFRIPSTTYNLFSNQAMKLDGSAH